MISSKETFGNLFLIRSQTPFLYRNSFSLKLKKRSSNLFVVCRKHIPREISISVIPKAKDFSFTLSYLINKCGLLPQAADKATERLYFEDSSKPDSNLKFFQDLGFDKSQIAKIITRRPQLLVAKIKILEPKIELLKQIGLSGPEVVEFLSKDAGFLCASLVNRIIPSFNFLKTLLHTDENVAIVIKRAPQILCYNLPKLMTPNIDILRGLGVPESNITKLITRHPTILASKDNVFKEVVREVEEMGFSPSSTLFNQAIRIKLQISKAKWKAKMDIFKSYGFSEDEIHSMFKSYPSCISNTEEKIASRLQFLVEKLTLEPVYLVKYPMLLNMSLEKRLIPRSKVLEILLSKGLVDKNKLGIGNFFQSSELKFSKAVSIKYEKEASE